MIKITTKKTIIILLLAVFYPLTTLKLFTYSHSFISNIFFAELQSKSNIISPLITTTTYLVITIPISILMFLFINSNFSQAKWKIALTISTPLPLLLFLHFMIVNNGNDSFTSYTMLKETLTLIFIPPLICLTISKAIGIIKAKNIK